MQSDSAGTLQRTDWENWWESWKTIIHCKIWPSLLQFTGDFYQGDLLSMSTTSFATDVPDGAVQEGSALSPAHCPPFHWSQTPPCPQEERPLPPGEAASHSPSCPAQREEMLRSPQAFVSTFVGRLSPMNNLHLVRQCQTTLTRLRTYKRLSAICAEVWLVIRMSGLRGFLNGIWLLAVSCIELKAATVHSNIQSLIQQKISKPKEHWDDDKLRFCVTLD